MHPIVISGQRVVISMDGNPYAFGTALDYSIDTQVAEISGIDSMLPLELAPERLRVTMSLKIYRTIDNDPSGNLFQSAFKTETEQDMFAQKSYITVEIRDRQTDATVMFIPRAMISSRTASVSSEDLMTENWTIIGIGFVGNEGPSGAGLLDRMKSAFRGG